MFRVTGRDVRGNRREISVNAATEEEARAIALASGDLASVDRIDLPSPAPPPMPRLNVGLAAFLGCLLCLGMTVAGAVLGAMVGHEVDRVHAEAIRTRWVVFGTTGTIVGLFCGVALLVAILGRIWRPR